MALPSPLTGPVEVQLATLEESIPGPHRMAGGSAYELKWDGYRLVVVRLGDQTRLWSRHGTDLTDRFPDIAGAAAVNVPPDTVVDGEVVVWDRDRLSFDLLQRRLAGRSSAVLAQSRTHPASYVAFDVLADCGGDLRSAPWVSRRERLESLARAWQPPFQLSPYTLDPEEARRWFDDYRAAGIEGLVVKGAASPYLPGRRGWVKVKNRETREVVVGAVVGPLRQPESLVAGLHTTAGELVVVGRSVVLSAAQAESLGRLLTPSAGQHPWPATIGSGRFGGGRAEVPLTHVLPNVVAEVTADTALQGGRFRHPLRFLRPRLDLSPDDLPPMPGTDPPG